MNEDLKKACDVLRKGGLILYPTDTIWGIGCDATNEEAVQRVYTLKQRADNKAMLLLLGNEARLESYVQEVPEIAWSLIEVADRPLTLIYPGARNLAPNLKMAVWAFASRVKSFHAGSASSSAVPWSPPRPTSVANRLPTPFRRSPKRSSRGSITSSSIARMT